MKAIEMKKGIYWVGGIDWDLRNFHGYLTQRGSTYNSYLIIDEKVVLIDAVKHYLHEELMERVASIIDPSKIDIVISQHVEMDHSGSIPKLMEFLPKNTPIYTSMMGEKGLKAHYGEGWNFIVAKPGDEISIGKKTLHFVPVPMVHWPDNMMTYLKEDKILFSNDAFGQHLASTERFDDEYPFDITMHEAKKYYANIVFPFDTQTQNALKAADDIDIEMIAPSHGLIWRKNVPAIVKEYHKWAHNESREKAVIVFDTMWHSTEMIANALKSELENKNIDVRFCSLQSNHISDIMTEILDAKYIFVGSPTLNNQMMPTVASFLTYMKGLKPRKRIAMAFGSYGWGGQSVGYVENELKETGLELLPQIRINYIPNKEALEKEVKDKLKDL